MGTLSFLVFLACLWGAYKLGHESGYASGKREGGKNGYKAGFIEGVRVVNLADLAQENPEEFERRQNIARIVDAEFDELSR